LYDRAGFVFANFGFVDFASEPSGFGSQ